MPILTITLKGDELKKKTINLHDPLNLRYFKLLHVNHNLLSTDINAAKRTLDDYTGAVSGADDNLALLFAQVSFLTSKDVNFYETLADGTGFSHNVFSVHQPFTIQLYCFDTSIATTTTDGQSHSVGTYHNKLRGVSEMVSDTLSDDKFMTLTFEYDEYDTAPRTH